MRRSIRARLCLFVIPLTLLFTIGAWAVYQGLGPLLTGPLIPGCQSLRLPAGFCQWQDSMLPWFALGGGVLALLWLSALLSLMVFRSTIKQLQQNVLGYQMGQSEHIADGLPLEVRPLAQQVNRIMKVNRTVPFNHSPPERATPKPPPGFDTAPEEETFPPAPKKEQAAEPMAIRESNSGPTSGTHPARQCRKVTELMRHRYPEIHYELNTDVGDQQQWPAAEGELADLYTQLLDNAGKRSRSQVNVFLAIKGNVLIFGVTDDGSGGPAEIPRGLEKGLMKEHEATGRALGLENVSHLVESHGGFITFDNNPQGGLEIIATLPAMPASAAQRKGMSSHH